MATKKKTTSQRSMTQQKSKSKSLSKKKLSSVRLSGKKNHQNGQFKPGMFQQQRQESGTHCSHCVCQSCSPNAGNFRFGKFGGKFGGKFKPRFGPRPMHGQAPAPAQGSNAVPQVGVADL